MIAAYRRNLQIVGANDEAALFQMMPDVGVVARGSVIEREGNEGREQPFKRLKTPFSACVFVCAVPQFGFHDGAQDDFGWRVCQHVLFELPSRSL